MFYSRLWMFMFSVILVGLCSSVQGLYFYAHERQPKCFYEELPKDTLVVGTYKAEVLNPQTNSYDPDPSLTMAITVVETFDNDHRVVFQRGPDVGRFTFAAADAGQHKICFTVESQSSNGGWLSSSGPIKLATDIVVGESSKIESEDKGKMENIVQRLKNLNGRLQDIRREQVYQREREVSLRDQSEVINSRVVRWTLIQLVVLSVTCAWQLSHLRSFFIKQKLT